MFDKKSEYALNKHDQDSIIYISVVNVYTPVSYTHLTLPTIA